MKAANLDVVSKSRSVSVYLLGIAFVFISYFAALQLNLFSPDASYSFRTDNFWSYSSRILRRGLPGEIIYRLDLYTGTGPYIFSLFMWVLFLHFIARLMKELHTELRLIEIVLFLLSPLFLLYYVDAEIFTLLPFLTLFRKSEKVRTWGTLFLIIVATLIREFSLLLFLPVLLYFIISANKLIRFSSASILVLLVAYLLFPKPSPTFLLENTYWMDKGFELQSHHLYKYTTMSLVEVIPRHLGFAVKNIEYLLIPVTCFMLFVTSVFFKRTKSLTGSIYLWSMIALCFVLTMDYGRYFYLFVVYAFLASSEKVAKFFTTFPRVSFISYLDFVKKPLLKLQERRAILLFMLVVSPSGLWASAYQVRPRFYTILFEREFLLGPLHTYLSSF